MADVNIKKYIAKYLTDNKLPFYNILHERYPTTPEKDIPDFGPISSMTSLPLSFMPNQGKDYNCYLNNELHPVKITTTTDRSILYGLCPFLG